MSNSKRSSPSSVRVADPEQALSECVRCFDAFTRDVRRPLDGMHAIIDLLMRQPLTPDAKEYVATLLDHHTAVLRSLRDAADLVRAENGDLHIEPQAVELRPLMDDIQEEWTSRAAGIALSISYDGSDLTAMIDARRLRQVFGHLIGRALAMTRRGGVEASLSAEREGERLVLRGRVRDSGAVMTDEKLAALFESNDENIEGVNLMLCRRLVEAMDGQVRAENNAGAGCTISFEITVAEAEDVADAPIQTAAKAAHILVVDDNATNRMVAEALCEMFNCTSESAEDGVEAVEAAASGRFDLILMDIKMPRMDGVEATKQIRAMDGEAGEVPIIALTANADPEDAMNYLAAGMSSVVEKPIKPEALLTAMNACLPEADEAEAGATVAA